MAVEEEKKIKRTPEEQKAWRKKQQHEWYLKNKERVLEHQRAYRQKLQQKYEERIKKSSQQKKEKPQS